MNTTATTVDEYLEGLTEWQAANLRAFRKMVHDIAPDITEDIKWGVPVFVYQSKVVFAMATFKNHTKYNFILNGALLDDPGHLFNNGLESKKSRGIDLVEGQVVDQDLLADLVHAAILQLQ